jgi:hypothetical protein
MIIIIGRWHISSPTLDPTVKVPFFKRTVKIHWIRSGTARAKTSLTKMFLEFSRTRLGDTLNANLARSKKNANLAGSYVAAMS